MIKKLLIGVLGIGAVVGLCLIFFTVYMDKTSEKNEDGSRPSSSSLNTPKGQTPDEDSSGALNDLKIIL